MGNSITKPKYTDRLAHGMPLRRPEEDIADTRACMGWHNRLCPQCRKRT